MRLNQCAALLGFLASLVVPLGGFGVCSRRRAIFVCSQYGVMFLLLFVLIE